jgi:hypothetical protein
VLGAEEVSGDIDLEHLREEFCVKVDDGHVPTDHLRPKQSRVVVEQVEPAELGHGGLDHADDLGLVADIDGDGER